MHYETCYIDKSGKNFSQVLEEFTDFPEFRDRYQTLQRNSLKYFIEGVSVMRTDLEELHEIILISKDKKSILNYKSTEIGIATLIDNVEKLNFKVLDSSTYYKITLGE